MEQSKKDTIVAPICVDGFDYDARDQCDKHGAVRYPSFYSSDGQLPSEIQKFNFQLYEFLASSETLEITSKSQ